MLSFPGKRKRPPHLPRVQPLRSSPQPTLVTWPEWPESYYVHLAPAFSVDVFFPGFLRQSVTPAADQLGGVTGVDGGIASATPEGGNVPHMVTGEEDAAVVTVQGQQSPTAIGEC